MKRRGISKESRIDLSVTEGGREVGREFVGYWGAYAPKNLDIWTFSAGWSNSHVLNSVWKLWHLIPITGHFNPTDFLPFITITTQLVFWISGNFWIFCQKLNSTSTEVGFENVNPKGTATKIRRRSSPKNPPPPGLQTTRQSLTKATAIRQYYLGSNCLKMMIIN